jgi:TonB family protein
MNWFTIAILLVALLGASAQNSKLGDKALNSVRQTPASKYDPALPSRPFGNWLSQVIGPQSGVSWGLGECVEHGAAALELEQDIPACVEATAILPDHRRLVAQIHVGSFKQGFSMANKFHFAVVEKDGQFEIVQRLSDLPQLLQEPFPIKKPEVVTLPQIMSNSAPQFYFVTSPALLGPLELTLDETETAPPPPPPKPATSPGISGGIIAADAVVKAQPVYPSVAKQLRAAGEVEVAITINESGQVIEAKAIKGHPALRAAAEEAARKWVFRPTLLDGKPVRQTGALTFIFIPPR